MATAEAQDVQTEGTELQDRDWLLVWHTLAYKSSNRRISEEMLIEHSGLDKNKLLTLLFHLEERGTITSFLWHDEQADITKRFYELTSHHEILLVSR